MRDSFLSAKRPLPKKFDTPSIHGLSIPREFYWINSDHPTLAGMRLPSHETPWQELHEWGFRWVVCLCSDRPVYDPHPLRPLVTVELSDLVESPVPANPRDEQEAISLIADRIIEKLRGDEGVVVHCAGGRGRTGTVLGMVLRKLGYPPERIVPFLDTVNKERGKPGWPESPWQQEVVENRAT